ncbi:FAD-dependent oxidoreductase [Pseudoduganella ginsengisoli]|uniref:FAD-dependent oxidoreductase n=1 Tax=Pseudoduganella ginsengisoli TaxID=1462440 RepID=A0A6L6Q0V1_9BURK|nr:FAD-dependent oxidoreductase [Pseudoduganella ginsengisoli]MTW03265.1 FAD-dependent oxidoreductase [Pseudoduganella ginsengisoli]
MNITNGASLSPWLDSTGLPEFPPMPGDLHTQVCVIGGGIGGLTAAYLLAREGRHVVLIDALGIGAGETGRTTAHFFPPDEWYRGIEAGFGTTQAKLVADSFKQAAGLVESIVRSEQIHCAFERVDGYLYALPENGFQDLGHEYDAALRAGADVALLQRAPGVSFDTGPCVCFHNQAQCHPLRYLDGLAEALLRHGGRIYCGVRAHAIDGDKAVQVVRTDHGDIYAQAVVAATNTPFNNRVVMHTKQAAYRTYVIALRIPRDALPHVLLWDTGDPYYYVRVHAPDGADHDLLIVGGADHKVGQDDHPEHRYIELERWARERFAMAQQVEYRWSGEVMEPADGLAYLGRNPMDKDNVYVITGDSGNGMTHCTIGAMIVSDLIMGRDNPWVELYDPARKVVHGLPDFVAEQANTLSYYAEWATGGEVESAAEIPPGQGAIVRQGVHKLAVYRDTGGGLHALSARCTHLGCVVHWNAGERSWDCPCHGSRFDTQGAVLHGPAVSALAPAALDSGAGLPPSGPADTGKSAEL